MMKSVLGHAIVGKSHLHIECLVYLWVGGPWSTRAPSKVNGDVVVRGYDGLTGQEGR